MNLFFDRDGTLNKRVKGGYVLSARDIILAPDISYLDKRLNGKNFNGGLITNQACVEKKLISFQELNEINRATTSFSKHFKNWNYYICPHQEKTDCDCRKPKTGLFNRIIEDGILDSEATFFIGDSESDEIFASKCDMEFIYVCWDGKCGKRKCKHTITGAIDFILNENP